MIFLLLFPLISVYAQQESQHHTDNTSWEILIRQANEYFEKGYQEEAIKKMLKAADILKSNNEKEKLAGVYVMIADTYAHMQALENAADFYIAALEINTFHDNIQKAEINEKLGNIYIRLKQYKKSLPYFYRVAEFYRERSDIKSLKRILNSISTVNRSIGNYRESLKINEQLLQLAKETDDHLLLFSAFNNIGYDYVQLKEYSKAFDAFGKALATETNVVSPDELMKVKINSAICLYNMNRPREAVNQLNDLLNNGNPEFQDKARIQNMLAIIYLNQDDLYNASQMSQLSISNARKSENNYLFQNCYHTYSTVLKAGNDPINALGYYEKYLNLRDSLLLEERLKEQEKSRRIYDLEKFEKESRLEIADENILEMKLRQYELERERQRQQYDSLQQASRLKSLQYESERQATALELETLRKTRALQESDRLRKDSIIQDQEIEIQHAKEQRRIREINRLELEKRQEQMVKRRAIIIAILLVLIAITILFGLVVTRKKNTLLAQQKNEIEEKNYHLEQLNEEITTQKQMIEEKNTAITDSIRYAEKIQSAVLPPEDFFMENLKNYFILFKPRDIVSGDFFWGSRRGSKIIIAAADCTGHGVPGAFMSMLGTAFLNEIVSDIKNLSPEIILGKLRNKVIEALRQTGEKSEARDGMDISLCVIDYENNILRFAGAYNPLYYFSNGELAEIKADRMPIGIQQNMKEHFTMHELNIKKGECIYMFSDGYADQFGGPEGKKFKSKAFRELISEIHSKPMQQQKEILDKTIEDWKGNDEQIDDILVMGVRI